jgi:SAM-dependent methyltransferase
VSSSPLAHTDGRQLDPDEEFDTEYFARLSSIQEHWWVVGMRDAVKAVLGPIGSGLDVLDLGSGSGTNLPWLATMTAGGSLHATDIAQSAVERSAARGLTRSVTRSSMAALPYRDGSFDLVVSIDVLQHLTRDQLGSALAEVSRVLKPDGRLVIRVNGDSFRSGIPERPDWRLYNPDRLQTDLTAAGFSVQRVTYASGVSAVMSLLKRPSLALRRLLARGDGESEADNGHSHPHGGHADGRTDAEQRAGLGIPNRSSRWTEALGSRLLAAENRYLASPSRQLAFGHAVIAVARPPAAAKKETA